MDGKAPDVSREIDAIQDKLLDGHASRVLWEVAQLSHREREVFEQIGKGLTTSEIAAHFCLATSTVETYRERLKKKLNLKSGNALVRQAVLWFVSQDGIDP